MSGFTFKHGVPTDENPDGLLDSEFAEASMLVSALKKALHCNELTFYALEIRIRQRRITRAELKNLRTQARDLRAKKVEQVGQRRDAP
ncbi:MAG TPA: hypothetical protein VGH06_02265 [Candidatus Udaeobacter sp.]|jgi:hypothetical protein